MSADVQRQGLCNARVVPGVRDGLVVRGDLPLTLSADDIASFGPFRTQIDLRSPKEIEFDGVAGLVELGATRYHLAYGQLGTEELPSATLTPEDGPAGLYQLLASYGPWTVAAGLELLTHVELPAFVHCTAGKDRTGIFSMALSLALGVSADIAVADYLASAPAMPELDRRIGLLPSARGKVLGISAAAATVEPAMAQILLDAIDSAGGIAGWLELGGASPDLVPRLNERLAIG